MKKSLAILLLVGVVGCGKNEQAQEGPGTPAKAKTAAEANAEAWVSDPNDSNNVTIETAIRNSIEIMKPTGELTKADLEQLTRLRLWRKQLTDVTGLEKLTQLEHLVLNTNQLTDVTGLEKLTQLTDLFIHTNKLTKLPEGLEKLTKLNYLDLSRNQLTDVTGLEKLTQLKFLNIGSNPDLTEAQIDQLRKALPNCFIIPIAKK